MAPLIFREKLFKQTEPLLSAEPHQFFVSAYKFAHGPKAIFLSSAEGITMHSAKAPGLQIDGLELRTAKFYFDSINVRCDQVETVSKKLQIPLNSAERLLAVKPKFGVLAEVNPDTVKSVFEPSGSVTVGYQVQGKKSGSSSTSCVNGRTEVGIEYLVEKR